MPLALDATERRIVGTLVEKELTVPDAYPMTVNSLVLGCNQKSNRDPETSYAEHEIVGALTALMDSGWVTEHEKAGGRTRRYAHRAREQLSVDEADLAILAELLLRGPQSAPELKARASRMRPLASVEDVERRLRALAARPVPYVRFIGRRPGERVDRWAHTISTEPPETVPAPGSVPAAAPAPVPGVGSPAAAAPRPSSPPGAPSLADLAARLARLEKEVEALKDEMARQHAPPDEPDASP